MTDTPSFSLLIEVHHWLDNLFLDHQLALLSLDAPATSTRLKHYESNLKLHIEDEEGALILLYETRTDDVPGGALKLFTGGIPKESLNKSSMNLSNIEKRA